VSGMNVRLGTVCQEARLEAGLKLIDIALAAGVSESVVSNFEEKAGWRRKTDAIVAAYEQELGLLPGELWRRAAGC
jgi:hypothetical protein